MNIFTPATLRGLRGRGLLAVAASLTMAAGTLTVMPNAHAESGRRICEYSFKALPTNQDPDNPRLNNPLLHVSLGVDYKKEGGCPAVDPKKLAATGYVDKDQVNPAPNKWTCEAWGSTHQTNLMSIGVGDPCPVMLDSVVYAFIWQDPTTPYPQEPRYVQLDEVWNYGW